MISLYTPLTIDLREGAVMWLDHQGQVTASDQSDAQDWPFTVDDLTWLFAETGSLRLVRAAGRITVTWDCERTSPAAIAKAAGILCRQPAALAASLIYFKSGWMREDLSSPADAGARLMAIRAFAQVPLIRRTLLADCQVAASRFVSPWLDRALAAWRAEKVLRDQSLLDRALSFRFQDGQFVISRVGPASAYVRVFGEQAVRDEGQPATSTLGKGFEKDIVSGYLKCLESGRPVYQHVRASAERRGMDHWVNFDRLILPGRDELHLVASLRGDLDVEFLGAREPTNAF